VDQLDTLPLEKVAKSAPGGTYAHSTHLIQNGGYREAIMQAYAWSGDSDNEQVFPFGIQVFNERFTGLDAPESVLEIWGRLRESPLEWIAKSCQVNQAREKG
jgi:hypothetical protein